MIVVLVLVFAVLYALLLITPIANVVSLPDLYEFIGVADAVPWPLLIAGIAVPPVAFTAALLLGRGRPMFDRALLFTAGLAAASAVGLGIIAWAVALRPVL